MKPSVTLLSIVHPQRRVKHRAMRIAMLPMALLLAAAATLPAAAGDWPAYLHDRNRSGRTRETLSLPLKRAWVVTTPEPSPAWPDPLAEPGGLDFVYRTTGAQPIVLDFDHAPQPVICGGRVFVGSSADDTLRALDLASGGLLWTFTASAPIRFAPHATGDAVFVGSDDGYVYRLDALSGAVEWQFRAAPADDMLCGNGRIISRWPLRSGVLLDNGVVYVTAGLWPAEGIFVYALAADTGEILWCNDTCGALNGSANTAHAYAITGVAPQGYLLATATRLIVPTGRSVPATFDLETGALTHYQHTGYQHKNGGSRATVLEEDGYLFFGYPVPRFDTGARDVPGSWMLRAPRFTRSYSAESLLIAPDAMYLGAGNQVSRLGKPPDTKRQWRVGHDVGRVNGLAMAGDVLIVAGDRGLAAYDSVEGSLAWHGGDLDGQVRGLAVAGGRLVVSTTAGTLYCFAADGSGKAPVPVLHAPPGDPAPAATAVLELADDAGLTRGYALVLGKADARVAADLARASDLHVTAALSDAGVVPGLRTSLVTGTPLYGRELAVHGLQGDGQLPYAQHAFNMVVISEDVDVDAAEIYRVLRPCGGVLCGIGTGRRLVEKVAGLAREDEVRDSALGAIVVRGKLDGAFDWDSKATLDERVRWPLELLWFGEPGPLRNVQGGPITRPANGRLFTIGYNHITAMDAYNGTELWARSVPYMIRHAVRAAKFSGPQHVLLFDHLAADDDSVYVKFGNVVFQLDAQRGGQEGVYGRFPERTHFSLAQEQRFDIGVGERAKVDADRLKLPAVSEQDLLEAEDASAQQPIDLSTDNGRVASATVQQVATGIRVSLLTYLEDVPESDYWELFFDMREPSRRDQLYEHGAFHLLVYPVGNRWEAGAGPAHPRIALSGGSSANDPVTVELTWEALREFLGRKPERFGFAFILNHQQGKQTWVRWNKFADSYAYAFNNGWAEFHIGATHADTADATGQARPLDELPRHALAWGRVPPHTETAPAPAHPEPHGSDRERSASEFLGLGHYGYTPTERAHPLTAAVGERALRRGKGCGGRIASASMEFLRCGTIGLYDFADDSGMRYFGGVRSGCYVSMLPALGVLFSCEASGYCSCSYNFKSSLALAPAVRRRNEDWALFHDRALEATFVHGAAVNLAAPGDRRDDGGVLWLQHPRPQLSFAMKLPLSVAEGPGFGAFRFNADRRAVHNTARPWLYASGLRGPSEIRLNLVLREATTPASIETPIPPRIDGRFDDLCWDGGSRIYASGSVYLRHDAENLYVHYYRPRPRDRRGHKVDWRATTTGEDAPVWDDHSLQIFLRDGADRDDVKCVQIGVSASGARFDALWNKRVLERAQEDAAAQGDSEELPTLEPAGDIGLSEEWGAEAIVRDLVYDDAAEWDAPWLSDAAIRDDAFVAELAIPWKALADAGLRRENLEINLKWRRKFGGAPVEVVRSVLYGEGFEPLLFPALDVGERPYTVRLHFSEPGDAKPGQRVFDVLLQDETVLPGFDIVREAGEKDTAVVREIQHVMADRHLRIAFRSHAAEVTDQSVPLLCAFEAVAE